MPHSVSHLTDEVGWYGYRAGQAAGSGLVDNEVWVTGDDPKLAARRLLIGIEDSAVTDSLLSCSDDDSADVLVNVLAEFGLSEEDARWGECVDSFGAGYAEGVLNGVVCAATAD